MKKENKASASRLQTIGDWAKGVSVVLLFSAFAACVLDVFVVTRGALTVPAWGYLVVIGSGVALQFVGAAVPNMKFRFRSNKPAKTEPYKIDS